MEADEAVAALEVLEVEVGGAVVVSVVPVILKSSSMVPDHVV